MNAAADGARSAETNSSGEYSPNYRVIIVRAWQEAVGPNQPAAVRYVLEEPGSGQRQGFINQEELFGALHTFLNSNVLPMSRE